MKVRYILVTITLLIIVCGFVYSLQSEDNDFFEENDIIDKTPIGRDVNNYWIYQTADKQIVKTNYYPTTKEGIIYAKLVGVEK